MSDYAFPHWRYHATKPACIVQDAEDEATRTPAQDGWSNLPVPAQPLPAPESPSQTIQGELSDPIPPPRKPKRPAS